MLSYWEQQSFTEYDHIIIGAGIVGLSTAIELRERFPGARILVVERGLLPTGASTRNAGFACMGSVTELLDDLEYMTESEVLQLFETRKLGLERLRKRLGDSRIGYAARGSYELISETELPAVERIEYLNELLLPVTGQPAFRLANEQIAVFGFSARHTKALIENICEGELHTGMMLKALTELTLQHGIEIKTGAEVLRFEEEKAHINVVLQDLFRNEELVLRANVLCLCTNAFTKQLLPDADVKPGRGQVLLTEPIEGLKFKGIYHFDKGFYYFREIDGRVLLGGGRNLDFEGETSERLDLNERIQQELERKLREIILPGTSFQVAQRWSGIMAFGASKLPIVRSFSDRVFGAFRMGGMGVALGSHIAMELVSKIP
ncbi:MAG: FAD-binding oxidoreductase [Bacteroidetes bacterium]|nr:FAD-binding oxidoreductase [Bacteroidota bacterium]